MAQQLIESIMLLERTQVWTPAPMLDGSQLPATPDPKDPMSSSGLFGHLHNKSVLKIGFFLSKKKELKTLPSEVCLVCLFL